MEKMEAVIKTKANPHTMYILKNQIFHFENENEYLMPGGYFGKGIKEGRSLTFAKNCIQYCFIKFVLNIYFFFVTKNTPECLTFGVNCVL